MAARSYYSPSGKFWPPGLALAALAAPIAAAVVGIVYAYAIIYIPIGGWITFLLAIGAGFGMGALSGTLIRAGKIRNAALSHFVGALAGFAGFYVSWAVWTSLLLQRGGVPELGLAYFATRPGEMWETIQGINAVGPWEMEGMTPTGGFLWFLWSLEALMILGPAIAMVTFMDGPFCENCGVWCETDEELGRTAQEAGNGELQSAAEDGNWNYYRALAPASSETYFIKVSCESCPSCGETNVLKTARVTASVDDNGNRQENADTIFEGLIIGSGDKAELRAALSNFAP